MKRLVLCCDGTWQSLESPHPTNVALIAQAIAPSANGIKQIVHYDAGVGNDGVVARGLNRAIGGAFGLGVDRNIEEAYRFLAFNYEIGDEIYIFGFSRGAYTARSLCGLLRLTGLLRREHAALAGEALRIYRDRSERRDFDAKNFRIHYSHPLIARDDDLEGPDADRILLDAEGDPMHVTIRYLGVWDTVGALGVPMNLPFSRAFNRRFEFHDTRLSDKVMSARHAVALDERRTTFAATLWSNMGELNLLRSSETGQDRQAPGSSPMAGPPYQQKWFPGDHGAVGGGTLETLPLAEIALQWIIEGAHIAGLVFAQAYAQDWRARQYHLTPFDARPVKDALSLAQWAAAIGGVATRPGPSAETDLAEPALARLDEDASYLYLKLREARRQPVLGALAKARALARGILKEHRFFWFRLRHLRPLSADERRTRT